MLRCDMPKGVRRREDAAPDLRSLPLGYKPMNAHSTKNEFRFKLPEMLSYHSTWDDADYEPVLPARRESWLVRAAVAVKDRLNRMMERQRVIRELEAMSDRDLADLGLSRYDIPRVFDPEFARERALRDGGRV